MLYIVLVFFLLWPSANPMRIRESKLNSKSYTQDQIELLRRIKGADIKSWMDTTEDPCKNFYKYSCGNWHRIFEGHLQNFSLMSAVWQHKLAMKSREQKLIDNFNMEDPIEGKVRGFYDSCRNVLSNSHVYKTALVKVSQEFGQFSFHTTSKTNFIWWTTVAKIHKMSGMDIIIGILVDHDFKDHNKPMIYIRGIGSKLSESVDALILNDFFGVNVTEAEHLVADMYYFDNALANVTSNQIWVTDKEQYSLQNTINVTYKYRHLFELDTFMKIALNITVVPEQIYISNFDYLDNLQQVMDKTRPETVENYLLWLVMMDYVVEDDTADAMESFCFDKTWKYFGKYLEHVAYQEFRSVEFEQLLYDLWHEIKAVFRDDLNSEKYHWMSKATREHAMRKLMNIRLTITSYDNENFEDYFKNLDINSTDYVNNTRNALERFELWRGQQLQLRSADFDTIYQDSYTPTYHQSVNHITFPVALLLPYRVWHSVYPKAILYGHIGFFLAHEMIHAFDDEARHYDAYNNINNWWDENAINEYDKRRNCFRQQYHGYKMWGQRVTNATYQGENIADNAAVRIVYEAYGRWLKQVSLGMNYHSYSEVVSNLPFNSQELFFISFAQSLCTTFTKEYLHDESKNDDHPPEALRTILTLSNFPSFSEVFKCDLGREMNSVDKCELF